MAKKKIAAFGWEPEPGPLARTLSATMHLLRLHLAVGGLLTKFPDSQIDQISGTPTYFAAEYAIAEAILVDEPAVALLAAV